MSKELIIWNEDGFFFENLLQIRSQLKHFIEVEEDVNKGLPKECVDDSHIKELGESVNWIELVLKDNNIEYEE